MMIYSYSEAHKKLSALLDKALSEGAVKLKGKDGQIFIIRPEKPVKTSPFDVRSLNLSITKPDILDAIREGRARY